MALEVVVQESYRWVLVAVFLNIVVVFGMGIMVGGARKKYKVPYPIMYANEKEKENGKQAEAFNCVQRAHQNTLEYLPSLITLLLVAGLQYPRVVAALGVLYLVARVQYFRGYSSGVAENRFKAGGFLSFPIFMLLLLCFLAFILHLFFPQVL